MNYCFELSTTTYKSHRVKRSLQSGQQLTCTGKRYRGRQSRKTVHNNKNSIWKGRGGGGGIKGWLLLPWHLPKFSLFFLWHYYRLLYYSHKRLILKGQGIIGWKRTDQVPWLRTTLIEVKWAVVRKETDFALRRKSRHTWPVSTHETRESQAPFIIWNMGAGLAK